MITLIVFKKMKNFVNISIMPTLDINFEQVGMLIIIFTLNVVKYKNHSLKFGIASDIFSKLCKSSQFK